MWATVTTPAVAAWESQQEPPQPRPTQLEEVSPLSAAMKATFEADAKYMQCIKVALLAHVSGYAPAVSVEFARKTLMSKDRPSFFEVEEAVAAVPTV